MNPSHLGREMVAPLYSSQLAPYSLQLIDALLRSSSFTDNALLQS